MSPFTQPLILKFLDCAKTNKRFELVEAFEYHIGSPHSDDVVIVPSGYRTDFASVPRLFWPILPPVGLYGKAAVIHDYLCDICEIHGYQYDQYNIKTRKEADEIFLEAMKALKVARWKQWVMFRAVRLWGVISELRGKHRPVTSTLPKNTF